MKWSRYAELAKSFRIGKITAQESKGIEYAYLLPATGSC